MRRSRHCPRALANLCRGMARDGSEMARFFIGLIFCLVLGHQAAAAELELTFIGNEAFAISDGAVTLVSDFPYRSGYAGYMEYDYDSAAPSGDVLSLITHRHSDHFDPGLFATTDWKIVGPAEVTGALAPDRVIPLAEKIDYKGIAITPIPTRHMDLEHLSYLVEWHGMVMYFIGDTEGYGEILDQNITMDLLFITPWVLRLAGKDGIRLPARRVIVYHHKKAEPMPTGIAHEIHDQGVTVTIATGGR